MFTKQDWKGWSNSTFTKVLDHTYAHTQNISKKPIKKQKKQKKQKQKKTKKNKTIPSPFFSLHPGPRFSTPFNPRKAIIKFPY